MKDEIKEIIKDIQLILDITVKDMVLLNREDILKLLDYITNLQEEINKLTEAAEWESKYYELEERCKYLERSNNRREDEIMSLRDECVEGETYKSRNEKAIEYLANCDWNCKDFENLYDILGGDDNE